MRLGTPGAGRVAAAIVLLAASACGIASAQQPVSPQPVRIGIYDSRAIAIAYSGSPHLAKSMQDLKARHRKARAAGDEKEASRTEAEMAARLRRLRQQGLGAMPVDDLLDLVAGSLSAIRKTTGVTTIVSRWDREALAKYPKAAVQDVTMPLVHAFGPGSKALRKAAEVQSRPLKARAGGAEDS